MNTQILVFDIEAALQRVESDRQLLSELINLFFEEFERTRPDLLSAVGELNQKKITELAHFVKSSSGNIGAMKVYDCARQLEYIGRKNELNTAAETLNKMLEEVVNFRQAFSESGLT